jgi:hypothetical protein
MILLVADTNLFFECRPLNQLPWQELGSDQVVVILTKPVLDEIDKHKKGSGRTRDRALEIFGRVREMLTTSTQEYEIQASSPRVVLRRAPNEKPDPTLSDVLDYSKNDERLIGITATIAAKEAGHDVRLFTDDTGPAATADGLGVPYLMIAPGWRRPPAETTEAKKIKALEKDLDTYRSQEPLISIEPPEGADEANRIVVTRKVVAPLTQDEIDGVLDALRAKHPLREDFSPPPTKIETTASGATRTTEYVAPDENAIRNYRDDAYPRWIENCRDVLAKLHEGRDEIEPRVVLRWPMSNGAPGLRRGCVWNSRRRAPWNFGVSRTNGTTRMCPARPRRLGCLPPLASRHLRPRPDSRSGSRIARRPPLRNVCLPPGSLAFRAAPSLPLVGQAFRRWTRSGSPAARSKRRFGA